MARVNTFWGELIVAGEGELQLHISFKWSDASKIYRNQSEWTRTITRSLNHWKKKSSRKGEKFRCQLNKWEASFRYKSKKLLKLDLLMIHETKTHHIIGLVRPRKATYKMIIIQTRISVLVVIHLIYMKLKLRLYQSTQITQEIEFSPETVSSLYFSKTNKPKRLKWITKMKRGKHWMQRFIDLFMLFFYIYFLVSQEEEIDEPLPPATLTPFST